MESLEQELQITIQVVSLLKGSFELIGVPINLVSQTEIAEADGMKPLLEYISLENYVKNRIVPIISSSLAGSRNEYGYLKDTGRFGIRIDEVTDDWIRQAADELKKKRVGTTLCIGTGEFMYIPMKLASYMGENIYYQSTTRSPIYPNDEEHYGAKNAFCFSNPEDLDIAHYLYNIKANQYDDIFLFFERKVSGERLTELLAELTAVQVKKINIVYCSGR